MERVEAGRPLEAAEDADLSRKVLLAKRSIQIFSVSCSGKTQMIFLANPIVEMEKSGHVLDMFEGAAGGTN